MNAKELQAKIQDYTRYAMILTTVSVFLYIGVAFQHAGKEAIQIFTMMGATVILLGGAAFYILKARKMKKLLQEQDDQ
ncbi:YrhC family protein [Sutcliffiella horikoshii]|uniref:YrhC family protein n=1 Tax=Sutcliffiella horikoshii TaxID=79883 RepID=UPI0007D075CE|nr:YrhC family protein [Sutcliffiella horikoshii]MCM3619212.1 YrhC family protein [Sutcliffiella horikoshii]